MSIQFEKLYIGEKPSVGKAIAETLAKIHGLTVKVHSKDKNNRPSSLTVGNFAISWLFGHILELAEPEYYDKDLEKWEESAHKLPFIPTEWVLLPTKDAKDQYKLITELVKASQVIVHAGDPDREGQLLVDEVLEKIGNKKPVKRILPNAIDESSMRKILAVEKPNEELIGLFNAGKGRSRADYIVGMNLTRAATIANQRNGFRGVISIGRVQTPTLALMVRRHEFILNFKPQDFFEISADFKMLKGRFSANLVVPKGNSDFDSEGRLLSMDTAGRIKNSCEGAKATILDYKVETKQKAAPLPFHLMTLQKKASSKFKLSAKKVLEIAQSLYEKKITSYPRTDSPYLPEDQWNDAPRIIRGLKGISPDLDVIIDASNCSIKSGAFNTAKASPHHGIVPTGAGNVETMTPDERKVFNLIVRNYLAQFFIPYEYQQTSILAKVGNLEFKTTGSTPQKMGWKKVFGNDDEDEKEKDAGQLLPQMVLGEEGVCHKLSVVKKQTKAPLPFSEATILHAMCNVHEEVSDPEIKRKLKEVKGIGTPATQADTIETLKDRGYISSKIMPDYLIPTPAGIALIQSMPKDLVDVTLTALWENALERIQTGSMSLEKFIDGQTQWIRKLTHQTLNSKLAIPVGLLTDAAAQTAVDKAGKPCPECGKGILRLVQANKGENKGNMFLSCSCYPECKYTEDIDGQDLPKTSSRGRGQGGKKGSKGK